MPLPSPISMCAGGGAPRDSAGSGATEEGLTSRGGLKVPWTARRSNQSILKEISPGISLEGPGALPQRRVVWMWFGAFPGAFGLGRAKEKGAAEDGMVR